MNTLKININLNAIESLTLLSAALFNYIVGLDNNYEHIYVSRETIARNIGCSLHYVDKLLAKLIKIGAIIKIKRPYPYTNVYKIPDILHQAEIRDHLASFFSSFATWGMASLMRAVAWFRKKESLLRMNIINRFSKVTIEREYTALDDIEFLKKQKQNQKAGNAQDFYLDNTNLLFKDQISNDYVEYLNKNNLLRDDGGQLRNKPAPVYVDMSQYKRNPNALTPQELSDLIDKWKKK